MKKETTDFDDWPIKVGPKNILVPKHKRYVHLFALTVIILPLVFMILKDIKVNMFVFNSRTAILFSDGHTNLVHLKGCVFKLDVKNYWQRNFIELSNEEYACATVMPSKKYIFGNWTEKQMCGDYRPIYRKTKSDRYPMPMQEELFDALGFARIFSTLDLRFSYHQLPLLLGDRVKTAFWEIDKDGKDQLYH